MAARHRPAREAAPAADPVLELQPLRRPRRHRRRTLLPQRPRVRTSGGRSGHHGPRLHRHRAGLRRRGIVRAGRRAARHAETAVAVAARVPGGAGLRDRVRAAAHAAAAGPAGAALGVRGPCPRRARAGLGRGHRRGDGGGRGARLSADLAPDTHPAQGRHPPLHAPVRPLHLAAAQAAHAVLRAPLRRRPRFAGAARRSGLQGRSRTARRAGRRAPDEPGLPGADAGVRHDPGPRDPRPRRALPRRDAGGDPAAQGPEPSASPRSGPARRSRDRGPAHHRHAAGDGARERLLRPVERPPGDGASVAAGVRGARPRRRRASRACSRYSGRPPCSVWAGGG